MSEKQIIIALMSLVFLTIFFTWQGKTLFKSILLFLIIMFPKRKIHLPSFLFPKIKISSHRIKIENRIMNPDIYYPNDGKKHPGLIVFAPLAREGKRDPFVINFLCGLARLGFTVMVSHWSNRKMGEMFLTDPYDFNYSIKWFKKRKNIFSNGVGVIAISYGTGPVIIANKYKALKENIKYFVMISGYIDLLETARTAITGEYSYKNINKRIEPDSYAKYILFNTASRFVDNKKDKKILQKIAELSDNNYNIIKILQYKKYLSSEARKILHWIISKNTAEFKKNYVLLPEEFKKYFYNLTPQKDNLNFEIPVMIVHSTKDNLVPYTESLRMYDQIKSKDKSLVLVDAFEHTIPLPATFKNIFNIYIPNFFRLVRLIYLIIYYQDKK